MKHFILGVATTLLALALALTGLVWSLGRPGDLPQPPSRPPQTASTAPARMPQGSTWLGELRLASTDLLTTRDRLTGVRLHGIGVTLSDKGIHAQHMGVDATLPFGVAATQVGSGTRLYAVPGGKVGMTRRVSLLGRDVEIRAVGSVRADRGELLITPERIDLGGPVALDDSLSEAARRLVTIRQPLRGLPRGLSLTSVAVGDTGFRAHLSGRDVTLSP